MALVFGHQRLDLGQFPYLMPQRLRVAARELRPTTSAFGRFERLHVVALVGWNQRSFVFLMAGLPATFLLRFSFRRLRPGVRMLRAGRQRGVLRRLAFRLPFQLLDPRFQFRDFRQQRANDRLGFGRLASNDFFGNIQRHGPLCRRNGPSVSRSVHRKQSPQGVNHYHLTPMFPMIQCHPQRSSHETTTDTPKAENRYQAKRGQHLPNAKDAKIKHATFFASCG